MSSEQELRADLAALIRENVDEIAEIINTLYNHEFPMMVPYMESGAVKLSWTKGILEDYARIIEQGTCDQDFYLDIPCFTMEDPRSKELSQLSTFVSSILFHGRILAPFIYNLASAESISYAKSMLRMWEAFVQQVVVHNCNTFCERLNKPERLSREWSIRYTDLLQELEEARAEQEEHVASEPEAPATGNPATATLAPADGPALSKREREVLDLVVEGRTNMQIATALGIGQNTVKTHVSRIFDKYNVNSRSELVAKVLRR